MRSTWTRKAILGLVVLLAVSGLAFATGSQEASGQPGQSAVVDEYPVTLTMGLPVQNMPEGDGTHQEKAVFAEITSRTNVTLDFVVYDDAKFRVLMAGGDLPDLFGLNNTTTPIEVGATLPLDDLLEQYGQNILRNIPTALTWSKEIVGDGTTYFLPVGVTRSDTSTPYLNGQVGMYTRYDIYKAIGSPEFDGEDEYLQVLADMQEYQREATGNDRVFALGAWSDWGLWPYYVSYPFSFGFTNLANNHFLDGETGEIEDFFLTDGIFWQALRFYNKAYRMGIFDPEALTMGYSQYADKVTNGLILAPLGNWLQPDVEVNGELAINVLLPGAFPVIYQLYPEGNPLGYRLSSARAISSGTKHPERAMQLLNFLDSDEGARLVANGVRGVDWDYVNGEPQIIGERLDRLINGTAGDYDAARGINRLWQFYTSGGFETADGYPTNLELSASLLAANATRAQREFAQDFGDDLDYPGQVYDLWYKQGLVDTILQFPLAGKIMKPAPEEVTVVHNQAAEFMSTNIHRLLLAESDQEFQDAQADIIVEMNNMGVAEANAIIRDLLAEAEKQVELFD